MCGDQVRLYNIENFGRDRTVESVVDPVTFLLVGEVFGFEFMGRSTRSCDVDDTIRG